MLFLLFFFLNFNFVFSCNDFKAVTESLEQFNHYSFSKYLDKLLKKDKIKKRQIQKKISELNTCLKTKVKVSHTPEIINKLENPNKGQNCNIDFKLSFLTFLLTQDFLRHVYCNHSQNITITAYNFINHFFKEFFQEIYQGNYRSALSKFIYITSFFQNGSRDYNSQLKFCSDSSSTNDFYHSNQNSIEVLEVDALFEKINPQNMKINFISYLDDDENINCWYRFCEKILTIKDKIEYCQNKIKNTEEEPLRLLLNYMEMFVKQMGFNKKNIRPEKSTDSLGYYLASSGSESFEEEFEESDTENDLGVIVV